MSKGLPPRQPGAGVRAQADTRTGYAHTDDISLGNLEEAARQARAIADRSGSSGTLAVAGRGRPHDLYTLVEPPIVTALERKLDLLRRVDAAARAADPRVKQVIASLSTEEVVVLLATASGWTVGDVRPLTRLNVTVIAEDGGKREIGSWGGGGRVPLRLLPRGRPLDPLRRRGRATGNPEAARGRGARRHDDRRARARLAGHPAARGDRPRPGGGLQPQGRPPSPGVWGRRSPPSW